VKSCGFLNVGYHPEFKILFGPTVQKTLYANNEKPKPGLNLAWGLPVCDSDMGMMKAALTK
jgi:hypothetical protein